MNLTSSAFANNESLPSKYTCDGDNVNPPLMWSEVPAGVKSFALIVDDPDAPSGDFVHWIMWNIPADSNSIEENSAPIGAVQGTTDFGSAKWGRPCPPTGAHHYQFQLFALDALIDLSAAEGKGELEAAMSGHVLAAEKITGIYQRR